MRITFSRLAAAALAGISSVATVSAHPGHASTDIAAQVAQPFAGPDHFVAFVALTSVLLLALRAFVKARAARNTRLQAPNTR